MKHHRFLLFFVFLILLQGQINAQIEINNQDEKPVFTPNQDSTSNYQNVIIITYPKDAFLTVNKKYLGTTPLEARLGLGINHFYITKPGYQVFENKFIITKNSGRFEIHLTQENSLSRDSVVAGSNFPPHTTSVMGQQQNPYKNGYLINDSIYQLDKLKFLSDIEKLDKRIKLWYNISLGCLAGGTISSIFANVRYKSYKSATENVNQIHNQIVIADNISYVLFANCAVSFIVAISYEDKIVKHGRKYGSFSFYPGQDGLTATFTF